MKNDENLPEEERRQFIRRLVGMAGFGAPVIRSFTMAIASGSLLAMSTEASALIVGDGGGDSGGTTSQTTGTTIQTTSATTIATTIQTTSATTIATTIPTTSATTIATTIPTTFATTSTTTIPTTFETTVATTIPTTFETTYATTGPTTFMTTRPGGGGGKPTVAPELDATSAVAALTVLAGSLLVLADRSAPRADDSADQD
jgi:hypothetical protein